MLGLRGSASILSDISLRLRQSISFNGGIIRAQCISIKAGMEIPDNKRLEYALPYIHGIGLHRARQILSELNMEKSKLAKDLTKREVVALGQQLSKYILGRELVGCVQRDIGRLRDIQCYRGTRHGDKLPCRGQRTHTNARTKKCKPTIPSLSRNL
ncbi:small ribosomal subunit protein uS13m isoform X2 [Ziziphus jujuba]|uniref:Small ribosomal subunit protein uS13m isoform X2 n=2 Tax=Ziziphus jujuba TaxID=326968 RepID=A0A6P4AST4_ZIZJJ|nr:small ribosomal subunit protein uS13m isoform X2 [Ziziphus jujuba]KAH7524481.1 hypothetical protein FEM48_Zijuj06G0123800 [Ziziphus jujuba var. spinosa]